MRIVQNNKEKMLSILRRKSNYYKAFQGNTEKYKYFIGSLYLFLKKTYSYIFNYENV